MSVRKSAAIGLAIGLVLGAGCAVFIGGAMLDNNNQGEFADSVTGEWTPYFWQLMAFTVAAVAIPVTAIAALIGLAAKAATSIERSDGET